MQLNRHPGHQVRCPDGFQGGDTRDRLLKVAVDELVNGGLPAKLLDGERGY